MTESSKPEAITFDDPHHPGSELGLRAGLIGYPGWRYATSADLAAAIKAMPSPQRTMLLIDVVEDSSALGQVRNELEAVKGQLAEEREKRERADSALVKIGAWAHGLSPESERTAPEIVAAIARAIHGAGWESVPTPATEVESAKPLPSTRLYGGNVMPVESAKAAEGTEVRKAWHRDEGYVWVDSVKRDGISEQENLANIDTLGKAKPSPTREAKDPQVGVPLCKRCFHPAIEHTDGCPPTESHWLAKLREEQQAEVTKEAQPAEGEYNPWPSCKQAGCTEDAMRGAYCLGHQLMTAAVEPVAVEPKPPGCLCIRYNHWTAHETGCPLAPSPEVPVTREEPSRFVDAFSSGEHLWVQGKMHDALGRLFTAVAELAKKAGG
jgi:hypothetical protein